MLNTHNTVHDDCWMHEHKSDRGATETGYEG